MRCGLLSICPSCLTLSQPLSAGHHQSVHPHQHNLEHNSKQLTSQPVSLPTRHSMYNHTCAVHFSHCFYSTEQTLDDSALSISPPKCKCDATKTLRPHLATPRPTRERRAARGTAQVEDEDGNKDGDDGDGQEHILAIKVSETDIK